MDYPAILMPSLNKFSCKFLESTLTYSSFFGSEKLPGIYPLCILYILIITQILLMIIQGHHKGYGKNN